MDRSGRFVGALAVVFSLVPPGLSQSDTEPPVLVDFDFSPKSVDVTNGPTDVTCEVTLSDTPAGVRNTRCVLYSPRMPDGQSVECLATSPSSGDIYNGIWTCTTTIPQYAEEGTWYVNHVMNYDSVDNRSVYMTLDLEQLGFPTELTVISDEDITPPALTEFDFSPKSVDVTNGPTDVTCEMTLSDTPAGVRNTRCVLYSPRMPDGQSVECLATSPSSGNIYNGIWTCTTTIPQYAEEGTWYVNHVMNYDSVDNRSVYMTLDLEQLGFPTELTVISNEDITPPALTEFDFSPKSVDVTNGPTDVTCEMTLSDTPAGVRNTRCVLYSPRMPDGQSVECLATSPSSGNIYNGIWTCTTTIPQYAEEGTWYVNHVMNYDSVDNRSVYMTLDLEQLGFPTELTVGFLTGGPFATVATPADGKRIRGNSVTIRARLVHGSPADVSPTLGIRFDHRALPFGNFAPVPARNPNHANPDTTYPYFIHWDVSEVADGDYELRTVAHDLDGNPDPSPETITVTIDHAGTVDVDENENAGGLQDSRTALDDTVASEAESADHVEASTATELIVPAGALTSATDTAVLLHLGSASEGPRLDQPEQNVGSFVDVSLDSGQTDFEGGATSDLNISYSDADQDGVVDGTSIREDELELRYYDAASDSYLRAPGWIVMTEHNMVHAEVASTGRFALTGPLQPKVLWEPDRITLTWSAVSEATSYNVYRGNLGDLVDGDDDDDGLPDSGYGDCQNHLDPDPADTTYADDELPAAPGSGFYYVVSFYGASGESSLGNTSAGLRRTAFSVCP